MRFARMAAAFLLLGAVFSPLKYVLRSLSGVAPTTDDFIRSASAGLTYAAILVTGYVILTAMLWGIRRLLIFADAWSGLGLADLDVGLSGQWPQRWLLLLSAALLIGVAMDGGIERPSGIAEAFAAALAVLFAFAASQPSPNEVDEYDPIPLPSPLPPPEPLPGPVPPSPDDTVPLTMSWFFRREPGVLGSPATSYQIQVRASKARYEVLRLKDHTVKLTSDYGRFVRDGLTPEVDEATQQLRRITERDQLHTISEINNVLALAQAFRYVLDHEDKGVPEYPKYPLETMMEGRGDCEDHAIVAAACLVRLGYDVRLVSLEYGAGPGHMALAIAGADELPDAFALRDPISGRRFYYCEATTDAGSRDPHAIAFRMGEIPERDRQAKMELITIH